ncbi:MAG: L,D-transpeptidase [Ardenticatenaceae bacterium]
MSRTLKIIPLMIALIIALSATFYPQQTAEAGPRITEVGGYGFMVQSAPTYAYGSLDSDVNGSIGEGEIVFLNGWQIGVYNIGTNRWVSDAAVLPIINSSGTAMVPNVSLVGDTYYMDGAPITLPERHVPYADRFLADPTISATILYPTTNVPTDWEGELVDTNAVWFSPKQPISRTMRVIAPYSFIYLRTAPDPTAPLAPYNAYEGEVLTVYEVVGDWYRIGPDVWAPGSWGDEVFLEDENVLAYAPEEYHNAGKWISIDLNRQRLTAWEGNDVVVSSAVKSGKYGYHTPAGIYNTFSKVPNERMSGSDYDLMDVAWTQYFTYSGIAIHTAYWHNNYNGRPGSHGCVNTPEEKARTLFMWAPLGTTIVTHNVYVFDEEDIEDANKWGEFENKAIQSSP